MFCLEKLGKENNYCAPSFKFNHVLNGELFTTHFLHTIIMAKMRVESPSLSNLSWLMLK